MKSAQARESAELYVASIDDPASSRVVLRGMAIALQNTAHYVEPGYVVSVDEGQIYVQPMWPSEDYDLFDVAPDGERFLVLELDGPPQPLTLIQNWPALLER